MFKNNIHYVWVIYKYVRGFLSTSFPSYILIFLKNEGKKTKKMKVKNQKKECIYV